MTNPKITGPIFELKLYCNFCTLLRDDNSEWAPYECSLSGKSLISRFGMITPNKDCPYIKTNTNDFLLSELEKLK